MKVLNFKEQNTEFVKNKHQYNLLPGLIVDKEKGSLVFCMGLSFIERLRILFTGRMWCMIITFGKPLYPIHFTTKKRDYFYKVQQTNSEKSQVV